MDNQNECNSESPAIGGAVYDRCDAKPSIDPAYYRRQQAQTLKFAGQLHANPRQLIDQEIDYHNRQANNLCRLRNALPAEMSPQAEQALSDLILRGHIGSAR